MNTSITNNLREALEAAVGALEDEFNTQTARRDSFPASSEYHFSHKIRCENARRHIQTLQRFLAEKTK